MATVGNTETRKFNHSNSAKYKGAFLSRNCNFQMKPEELHLNLMLSFMFKMNFDVFIKIFCKKSVNRFSISPPNHWSCQNFLQKVEDYKKYLNKNIKIQEIEKMNFLAVSKIKLQLIIAVLGTGSETIKKAMNDSAIKFVNVSPKSPPTYSCFERSSFAKTKNVLDKMIPGGLTYN